MNATTGTIVGVGGLLLGLATAGCAETLPAVPHSEVAFSAPTSDVEPFDSGPRGPRVLATHVMPMRGVTAVADGGHVWLRFRTTREPRVVIAIDPETLEVVDGSTPPVQPAPGTPDGPVEIDVHDQDQLYHWVGPWLDDVLSHPGETPDDGALAPMELGYHGSAIGMAAVAVGKDCKGVLAFIESNGSDSGFDLVVMRTSRCP